MQGQKEARLCTLLILPFVLAGVGLARSGLIGVAAAEPEAATAPPDLAFFFHADWWSADSFSAEAATDRTVAGDFDGDGVAVCDLGAFEYGFWTLYLPLVLKP